MRPSVCPPLFSHDLGLDNREHTETQNIAILSSFEDKHYEVGLTEIDNLSNKVIPTICSPLLLMDINIPVRALCLPHCTHTAHSLRFSHSS